MGKAYTGDKGSVIMEVTTEDLLNRWAEFDEKTRMPLRQVIRQIAWAILNNHPAGRKMLKDKTIKYATIEAIEGKFIVEFMQEVDDRPPVPQEKKY